MSVLLLGRAAIFLLAPTFCAVGLVQLVGPGFVRRAYQRWEMPRQYFRLIGALELLAALLLARRHTELWGVVLAGMVNFFAVMILLKNREYSWALPGLAIQAALTTAIVAAVVQEA